MKLNLAFILILTFYNSCYASRDVNSVLFRGDSAFMGMKIERIYDQNGVFLVVTTGARYEYTPGELKIYQGHGNDIERRLVATITIKDANEFEKVKSNDDHVLFGSENLNIGIYGDSTCLVGAKQNCYLTLKSNFEPAFRKISNEMTVLSDVLGGLCISPQLNGTGFAINEKGRDLQLRITKEQVMIFRAFSTISDKSSLLTNDKNPQAIREITEGKKTVANAAWWGFDKDDSTPALQAAINSGAAQVFIPYVGYSWKTLPIELKSNQQIVFGPGVQIEAKPGEFRKTGDRLFLARGKNNIALVGYGAILKMNKPDYIGTDYEHGQWRNILVLEECNNVRISGLTFRDSGGDGIYFAGGTDSNKPCCRNVVIENCLFDNNLRQGITVISGENIRINNCAFKNTSGSQPGAGIDLEPNTEFNRLKDIVISNCISINNEGPGFVAGLHKLNSMSQDVSVSFLNCYTSRCKWGMQVLNNDTDASGGQITFEHCVSEDTLGSGIQVATKSRNFNVTFSECKIINANTSNIDDYEAYNVPILLRISRRKLTEPETKITLANCSIYDTKDRPAINIRPYDEPKGAIDVAGALYYFNKMASKSTAGFSPDEVDLKIYHISNT